MAHERLGGVRVPELDNAAVETLGAVKLIREARDRKIDNANIHAVEAVEAFVSELGPLAGPYEDPEYLRGSALKLMSILPAIDINLSQRRGDTPRGPNHAITFVPDADLRREDDWRYFIGALGIAVKAFEQPFFGYIRWSSGFDYVRIYPDSDIEEVTEDYFAAWHGYVNQ